MFALLISRWSELRGPQPNLSGPELNKLRAILLRHCDVNKDGKIQKNELSLCLGVKHMP